LLAHPNHFSKNLDVEAVALGFEKDFFLGFGEFLDFPLDVLDALDDSPQLITRNVDWSAHGLLLVNMAPRNFAILAAIARRTSERGDQPVNVRPASPNGDHGEGRASPDARTFGPLLALVLDQRWSKKSGK
jgi:hypothetical protein